MRVVPARAPSVLAERVGEDGLRQAKSGNAAWQDGLQCEPITFHTPCSVERERVVMSLFLCFHLLDLSLWAERKAEVIYFTVGSSISIYSRCLHFFSLHSQQL